ncbi:hypothetical protein ACHAXS_010549 [Conticribra weissflogii]
MAPSSTKTKFQKSQSAAAAKTQPTSSITPSYDLNKHLSKKRVWQEMPHHRASSARVDSEDDDDDDGGALRDSRDKNDIDGNGIQPRPSPSSPTSWSSPSSWPSSSSPLVQSTLAALLNPARLAALEACDVAPIPYQPYDFFSHMLTFHGRNFSMIAAPLFLLFLWGLLWQVLFTLCFAHSSKFGASYGEQLGLPVSDAQIAIANLDALVSPLSIPLSFLLTFRLDRSAVRFWDARQACGKITEVCRATAATALAGALAPIRRRRRRWRQNSAEANVSSGATNGDEEVLALLCEYARWLAVFPVAVEHFLRPHRREGWDDQTFRKKRRFHIGPLLSEKDAALVLMECDDDYGNPAWFDGDDAVRKTNRRHDALSNSNNNNSNSNNNSSNKGSTNGSQSRRCTRTRDPPLVVLNRLQELAFDLAYFDYQDPRTTPHPQAQSALYQQLNGQINILYESYGTMERIKSLPLPFVYATHLRTFLWLYLILWNMTSVAHFGWIALPCLFMANWSLMGIEAASVECERPFHWNRNHLTLGKFAAGIARNVGQTLKEVRW